MADIRMFRAIRPKPEKASAIAALPYDVYDRREAGAVVKKNPDSFLAIDRAETNFPSSVNIYAKKVYEKARDLIREKIKNGDFIMEEYPCYYVYSLCMNGRTQRGFVGCVSIDDYENGVVKKHENTRAEKEKDRIRHIDVTSMQTGPIFLAYRKNEILHGIMDKAVTKKPLYDFVAEDGVRHTVWAIRDPEEQKHLRRAFRQMDSCYIADGHHRCASAVKVGQMRREEHPGYTGMEEFNTFLAVLFEEEELMIMDYNRVLKNFGKHTAEDLLAFLEKDFVITSFEKGISAKKKENEALIKPAKKGEYALYLQGTWYRLKYRGRGRKDPVKSLDVSILQDRVLSPFFGIDDPKTDPNIDFVGGIRGLKELEKRCKTECVCAFALYPTSITELFSVADAGLLMPPKSTWFEPKLRSGLFLHEIEK
ncbi:MAG: DUF1015 domain-containing protein [Lachnospiraceae bacterium]|nr:DUF1015 domain-containing protein [Lachnospiraceae bacterium]